MTVLDDRQIGRNAGGQLVPWEGPRLIPGVRRVPGRPLPARGDSRRPAVAPLTYRGNGLAVSRAVHIPLARRPRSATMVAAILMAGLSALITFWLGWLGHLSGPEAGVGSLSAASATDRLAVVHVLDGETLQQLAERMSPDVPADQAVERIKDLNKLSSTAVVAGQTLIAPVS